MFINYILILSCLVFILYNTIFYIPLGNSIQNEPSDDETFQNESIKFIDKEINLKKLSDPSTVVNSSTPLTITVINKELTDDKKVTNESQQNLDSLLLESPIINKKWYGLDIYSAAEVGKANQSLRPINPPDISIAVGKDHIAQVVHSSIQIWNKNGLTLEKKLLHDLFNISKDHYITDPMILYDNSSDRWFATIVDGGKEEIKNGSSYYTCLPLCKVIIAVSKNDDPTHNWYLFPINASKVENFPDIPKIAVSKFNLIMTTKEFQVQPSINESKSIHRTYIINKNFINQTDSTINFSSYSLSDPAYAVPYINPIDSSSTITLFKENSTDVFSPVSSLKITDYLTSSSIHPEFQIKKNFIKIPMLFPAPKFKQPLLYFKEKEEVTILSALRNDTSVWIAMHSACQPAFISDNVCINILRFDKIIGTGQNYNYSLVENTQFHIDKTDVYYPAIGVSRDGNLFFISGFSNSTLFPSLRISHLVAENQTNDRILILGSAVNNSTSYGDYFGSAIDPINGTVWLSGQYVDQSIPIPSYLSLDQGDKLRDKTWATIIANVS